MNETSSSDEDTSEVAEESFACSKCEKRFKVERYLRKHVARVHTVEAEARKKLKGVPLECRTCQAKFRNQAHLRRHQLSHLDVRLFKCDHCDMSFVQKAHLDRHIWRKHEDKINLPSTSASQIMRSFLCPKCGHLFKTKYELEKHVNNVHIKRKCSRCKKTVSGYDGIKVHEMRCRNGKESCDTCGASFDRLRELEQHLNACKKQVSFECVPCELFFKQRVQLDRHYSKTHNTNKECKDCGETFENPVKKASHYLKAHQKNACGYCDLDAPDEKHKETHWKKLNKPVSLISKVRKKIVQRAKQSAPMKPESPPSVSPVEEEEEEEEDYSLDDVPTVIPDGDTFEAVKNGQKRSFYLDFTVTVPDGCRLIELGKLVREEELIAAFPILRETKILITDEFIAKDRRLSVQVPVETTNADHVSRWICLPIELPCLT